MGQRRWCPGSPEAGLLRKQVLWECFLPRAAARRAGEGPELHHCQAAPSQRGGSHSSGRHCPRRSPASPGTGLQPWLGWVWGLGSVHLQGAGKRLASIFTWGKPPPIFLPGVAPMNGPPGKRSALSVHLSTDMELLHLLRPCLSDGENACLPVGISSQRGTVTPVLRRGP